MNLNLWKSVANNWRELEDTVEKLSIVQKVTRKALAKVDKTGSVKSNIDNWDDTPFDDDSDFEIF